MNKSLLTLIALMGATQMFSSQVATVVTPGTGTAQTAATPSTAPTAGHATGTSATTSVQAATQTKFNLLLEQAIRTVVSTAVVDEITEQKAKQAGLNAYHATKVDSWSQLTTAQLNAIGEAVLKEATASYTSRIGSGPTQQVQIITNAKSANKFMALAKEVEPSWVDENPGTALLGTALVGLGGYVSLFHSDKVDASKVWTKLGYVGASLAALKYRNKINSMFKGGWNKLRNFSAKNVTEYIPTMAALAGAFAVQRYVAKHDYNMDEIVKNTANTLGVAPQPWYLRSLEGTHGSYDQYTF